MTPTHLDRLNPAQRTAATAAAPVLVLAGAGSGKTETLIRRVAGLILGGEAPDRLLCITFTAKAAGEMRTRLAGLLGADRTPRWVGTFHAVMARLLVEDSAGMPGLPKGFGILGQRDARTLLMQASGTSDAKDATRLQEAVSLLKNGLVADPRRLPRSSALARFETDVLARAAAVLPAYRAALDARQALDFDDLIALPVAAMRANPALAARWSARWAEVLVDEYQDTNHAQHALVRLLAGKARRVFAVGDDLQAIYGWRGAEVAHIRRFGTDFPGAPPPLKLETNYRSTPTILRAANTVAAHDPDALPKTLRPARSDAPAGAPIAVQESATPEAEGHAAALWVQALRQAQPGLTWRECAVLVRAGFIAEPILAALRDAGVPAQLVADREPEAPKEVLAAIAWLRLGMSRSANTRGAVAWDPAADDAFRRACAFPPRGLGAALFARLREAASERGLALATAAADLPATAENRQRLDAVLGIAGEIGDGVAQWQPGPADALRLAAEVSEITEHLTAGGSRLSAAWDATLQAAEQAGSVAAYCDRAALGTASAEAGMPDRVQVMTVHRAKGLEFDHVLLTGLEEGVWPNWQAEQHGAMAEERRLFYVGITRARHSLRLSWVRHRREWAGKPSRFLAELPQSAAGLRDSGNGRPANAANAMKPPSRAEADRLVADFLERQSTRGPR